MVKNVENPISTEPSFLSEIIRQNPKKKICKQANNVRAAMEKNGEILVEGQIPGEFIVLAKSN